MELKARYFCSADITEQNGKFQKICLVPNKIAEEILAIEKVNPSLIEQCHGVEVGSMSSYSTIIWLVKPKNYIPPAIDDPDGLQSYCSWFMFLSKR
jgi:hypothetical protein